MFPSCEALQSDGATVGLPPQGPSSQLDLESIRAACLNPFSPKLPALQVSACHTHVHSVNTHGVAVCLCDYTRVSAYSCMQWLARAEWLVISVLHGPSAAIVWLDPPWSQAPTAAPWGPGLSGPETHRSHYYASLSVCWHLLLKTSHLGG